MAYANHDLQMPLTHESCCRPGGGRVSIPAQECKAGLSLGLADQESRNGPETQTPAAPEPAPPQPSPWLLRPDPLLPTSALSGWRPPAPFSSGWFPGHTPAPPQAGRRGSSSAFFLLPKTRMEAGAGVASDVYRAWSPGTGDHPPPAKPLSETPLNNKKAEISGRLSHSPRIALLGKDGAEN